MGKYAKSIGATVVAVIGALVVALGTGATDFADISTQNWLVAGGAVLGSSALVWWTENGPYAPTIKAIFGFLGGGIASLVVALDDDVLTRAEQLTALGAAIVASGVVFQLKNKPDTPPPPVPA